MLCIVPFGLQRKTQRYAYEFYSPRPNRSLRSLGRIPVWLFFVVCNEINIIKLVIIIEENILNIFSQCFNIPPNNLYIQIHL